jgi:hypothetical protein
VKVKKLNYFEAIKSSEKEDELDWINDRLFINYGIVRSVVDINTVVAVPLVNVEGFDQPIVLTLLRPSSALFENAVEPQEGDRVLILALDIKARGMFDSSDPITSPNAHRRGLFSGVGLLLATFKGLATTTAMHDREGDTDILRLESSAVLSALLGRAMTAVFDSVSENEELAKIVFGKLSPLLEVHRAAATREHGFVEDGNGEEITVPAPVTERYSVEAPITRDIQGAQTVTIGVDKDGNATEAPVNVTIGEEADISINSASGLTLHFDKAAVFESGEDQTWRIAGSLTIEVDGKVKISSAGCTINDVLEVK